MLHAIRALYGFLVRREHQIAQRIRHTKLRMESLEDKRLLSVNAPDAINGTIFSDANNNNVADVGEGIQGAMIELFQDNGDGIFDPNNGDVQVGVAIATDANGEYCFTDLDQNESFFVRQPQQTVNGQNLELSVSNLIEFTPDLIIDQFQSTQTTIAVPPPISTDSSSLAFADESEVIGGERDLFVELTDGQSEVQLRVNPFSQEDVLLFDSSAGTTGKRIIAWDGADNDGTSLALGLNGRDLTQAGVLSAISMLIGVDANGGNLAMRLYQGDTNTFSTVTVPIPQTNGTATEWVNIPFTSFTGPVNPNNVDAIELELLTGNSSVDGQIDFVGVSGAQQADFENDLFVDLELEKTVDSNEVNAGDTVNWTLTLENNQGNGGNGANATATGVIVADALPAGVSFVNATTANGSFANGVWTLANGIAPGAQATLVIETTVNGGLAGNTIITNDAQVTAHDQMDIDSTPNNDDGDQSEDDEDNAQVTVGEAIDLEITKIADTLDVQPGGQVTFTISITNNANAANTAATGVQVVDTLPQGMTLVSGTPTGNGTFDDQTRTWSLIDPLMPGGQQTLTILANVNNDVQGNTELSNVAQVTAANEIDVDSNTNNDDGDQSEDDEASAQFTVGAIVDLSLTKTTNANSVAPGGSLTWTLNVTNEAANANTAATGVQITDVLPAGVTLTSAVPTGNGQFNNGIWSLVDPLQPGATASLTLMTTVASNIQVDKLTNVAQVTAVDQPDFDSSANNDDGDQSEDDEAMAMVTVEPRIDLEVSKTVSSSVVQKGDQVTWTVTVLNNSANATADATGVTLTDIVPAGLIPVSTTPSTGSFVNNVWTLGGPLAPGASASLSLVTTVDPSTTLTSITNVAQVNSANEVDVDSSPANDDGDQSEDDEANAQITIREVVDLELEKSVDRTTAQIGDTIIWTILIRNNNAAGNTAATGVTISDTLPTGTDFVSANASLGTYDANTGVWTLGSPLQAGQSATLMITTTIGNATPGQPLTNAAQVATQDQNDIDSTPGDGQQNDDDDSTAQVVIQLDRPMSKRSLLAR